MKFEQKIKSEAKLQGTGGVREEATLAGNINATFGLSHEDAYRRFIRPGAQALANDELAELAAVHSFYVFSTLEFQNREGRPLIFERNTDERITACISELHSDDQPQKRRDRLFVWEVSPEIKRAESVKQMWFLVAMIVLLVVASFMRYYYQEHKGKYLL